MKKEMKTLQQLIKSAHFGYVNPNITEEYFPVQEIRGKVELLDFGKSISSEDAIKKISEKGYEPANLYELLTFAEKWDGKDCVVALGSVWRRLLGRRFVAYLWGYSTGRSLGLRWFESDWRAACRFAAVRKVASGNLDTSLPLETLPDELIINGTKYRKV